MKLYKVIIKDYLFGVINYPLFVWAKDEEDMKRTIYLYHHRSVDSSIESFYEVDLNITTSRIL